jgi:hypothetical protein
MAKTARLYYPKRKGGTVEVVVPRGTRLAELVKVHEKLDEEVLTKIAPHACGPCLSGIPLVIREDLEQAAHVDLAKGTIQPGVGGGVGR